MSDTVYKSRAAAIKAAKQYIVGFAFDGEANVTRVTVTRDYVMVHSDEKGYYSNMHYYRSFYYNRTKDEPSIEVVIDITEEIKSEILNDVSKRKRRVDSVKSFERKIN